MADTHIVTNQVLPLEGFNPASSPVLIEALIREGGQWGVDAVTELGALSASQQVQRWGQLADRNRPVLHTHDVVGNRIDEVEYDPAYHELMRAAIAHGLHAAPWADPRPGAHVVRGAQTGVWTAEPGHMCPISMTYAVVPALRNNAELAKTYEPLLTSRVYDPELKVPAAKAGITAGMSMTEKQGGSDVRAGTTQAVPNADGSYALTGHKWFTSAPMCDVFLVLAQAPGGLSCFFLPASCPTAPATGCGCSGSRTNWATTPTPPARSNTTAPPRGWWDRRAAASRSSSRWSTSPGWTARWAARPACGWGWHAPPTTLRTARRSART